MDTKCFKNKKYYIYIKNVIGMKKKKKREYDITCDMRDFHVQ